MPQLETLRAAFSEDELAMRGIPADPTDTREKLEAYVDEYHPAYQMALDLRPAEVRVVTVAVEPATGSEQAFPATLVFDANGNFKNWEHKIPAGANLVDEDWESEGMKTCNTSGQGTSGCHDDPLPDLCGAHNHFGSQCGGGGGCACA